MGADLSSQLSQVPSAHPVVYKDRARSSIRPPLAPGLFSAQSSPPPSLAHSLHSHSLHGHSLRGQSLGQLRPPCSCDTPADKPRKDLATNLGAPWFSQADTQSPWQVLRRLFPHVTAVSAPYLLRAGVCAEWPSPDGRQQRVCQPLQSSPSPYTEHQADALPHCWRDALAARCPAGSGIPWWEVPDLPPSTRCKATLGRVGSTRASM